METAYTRVVRKLEKFYEKLSQEEQQAVLITVNSRDSLLDFRTFKYDNRFRVKDISPMRGYSLIEGAYENLAAFREHLEKVYPTRHSYFGVHGKYVEFGKGMLIRVGEITYY